MRYSMKEKQGVDIPHKNIISLKTQKGTNSKNIGSAHLECYKGGHWQK